MRLKNIFLIIIMALCSTSLSFAQDNLFEKYAEMDNVTSVYISKKMFSLFPSIERGGLNLANLAGKIDGLQILTSDNKAVCEKMRNDFKNVITKSHEELMRVKDNDTHVTFHILQKGDYINELIMLVDDKADESEYVIMKLNGKFTIQDIQEIAGSM